MKGLRFRVWDRRDDKLSGTCGLKALSRRQELAVVIERGFVQIDNTVERGDVGEAVCAAGSVAVDGHDRVAGVVREVHEIRYRIGERIERRVDNVVDIELVAVRHAEVLDAIDIAESRGRFKDE